MKFGKVLVVFMSAALLATPALAGVGKGYGKQVLFRAESRQIANTEVMECPMVNHMEGDRSAGNDRAGAHHNIHTKRR